VFESRRSGDVSLMHRSKLDFGTHPTLYPVDAGGGGGVPVKKWPGREA
jgi:hypothetical protein